MRAQLALEIRGSRMKPHCRCLDDRVVPTLRGFFVGRPFMTSVSVGLLSLAFVCSTVPTAAQAEEHLSPVQLFLEIGRQEKLRAEREKMQDSPIYKKMYNECVLKHLEKVKTDIAVKVLISVCRSEAKMYYLEQKRR